MADEKDISQEASEAIRAEQPGVVPPQEWRERFKPGKMLPIEGHWFKVPPKQDFYDAIVLMYIGPTGKTRKAEETH